MTKSVHVMIFFVLLLSPPGAAAFEGELAAHRAVYRLSLGYAKPSADITHLSGRMLVEFSGNRCEGYTLQERIVTDIADMDGVVSRTDVRFTSWESGDGGRFRFGLLDYRNGQAVASIQGKAERGPEGEAGQVRFSNPDRFLSLPLDVMFPTAFAAELLQAAAQERRNLTRTVFDGSDDSAVFTYSAAIGDASGSEDAAPDGRGRPLLASLRSWPVLLSIFSRDARDGVPDYELSFRLYENGVSTELAMDYGTFRLEGELEELAPLPDSGC